MTTTEGTKKMIEAPGRVYAFYRDGFKQMTLGKTLWKIIFLKLLVMFAVLKLFFFQGFLETKFTTDNQRAAYVIEQMTQFVPSTNAQKEVGKK